MFVSALVLSGRRDDDEEDFMEETISDDESAVSPVIATILMVAITVVLSGVVYVWAAQLADTDTKGVPVVTFSAENVDTGSIETAHWKITIGQAQTVLATQAVEVTVAYINATGDPESQTINLASPLQVYGFSPSNSDSLVTFGDVVTLDGEEVISTFSTGDDIYVKTHLADGTPLVDATIRIIYNPPGDAEGATLKTYRGLSWNQAV
jgi:flagellin-like protein